MFSLFGMFVAAASLVLYAVVVIERLVTGQGWSALWDRDILEFFLIGVVLFGVGLVGEYVGRIYQQVRDRPRYTVRAVLESDDARPKPDATS
jgi:undecaprenyl-phosphate 4-deoxy-4-formamido-L-arabinose transferase